MGRLAIGQIWAVICPLIKKHPRGKKKETITGNLLKPVLILEKLADIENGLL